MASTPRRLREIKSRIHELGGTEIRVEINKHLKIRFTNPRGVSRLLVASVTPSDWRGDLNVFKNLKRLMN